VPIVSGGAGGAAGAMSLLYSLSLASPGTFDQASISGSYSDLLLVATLRSAAVGASDNPDLRFNNDSGTNYLVEFTQTSGATVSGVERLAAAQMRLGRITASTGLTNSFTAYRIHVVAYANTSNLKNVTWEASHFEATTTGNLYAFHGAGQWESTAAINRVQLGASSFGNLLAGSQLRIYGVT